MSSDETARKVIEKVAKRRSVLHEALGAVHRTAAAAAANTHNVYCGAVAVGRTSTRKSITAN